MIRHFISRIHYPLLFIIFATIGHASLLTNGSFEDTDASTSPFFIRNASNTPGWTHILDGVDLIHNSYTQPGLPVLVDASDGMQFLDMNQASVLGGIEQIVSAILGSTYRLDLDTTAWATNSIPGTIGYQLYDPTSSNVLASGSFSDSRGGAWVSRSIQATAVSSQIGVRIQGLAANQAGMGLDNVRLNEVVSVPEPSEYVLVFSVLVSLIIIRRK